MKMEAEKKRIVLIAVDHSEFAEKAFDFYCDNVVKDGDYLCLVFVPECYDLTMASPGVADRLVKELRENVLALEKKFEVKIQQKKLTGKFRTSEGKPGEAICKLALEEHASMIIIGSRGLGKIRRTLLGSVSDFVLHHSHVPVVVVRH